MKKSLFLSKAALSAAGLFAGGALCANASLTLTISSGANSASYNDTANNGGFGAGNILVPSGSVGSSWSWAGWEMLSDYTDDNNNPSLDIDVYGLKDLASSSSSITLTLTETGVSMPGNSGDLGLALGGLWGSAQVTQNVLINGSQVGSQGPVTGTASHNTDLDITIPSSPFTLTDQVVITASSSAAWKTTDGGDLTLDLAPVPEPSTILAGAMLLLPFGLSTLRILRRSW